MKPGWNTRLVHAILITSFSFSLFTAWRAKDWIYMAAQAALILSLSLELVWPDTLPRSKFVKAAKFAAVTAVIALLIASWREQPSPIRPPAPAVVPGTLQVTPAQGAQGQTLAVTVTGSSVRFNDGSSPHFGPGINVLDSRVDGETLSAHIEIVAGTPTGYRRVWVVTPGTRTTMDDTSRGAFQVVAGIAQEAH